MSDHTSRRLALVTGASAGIGQAFAGAYAARGYDVALVARRVDRLEALASELSTRHNVEAFAVPADLSLWDAEKPIFEALSRRGRTVDALVNNAGFGIARIFTDAAWRQHRDFLMTMAVAPCALAYGVLPAMAAQGRGSIINVASVAGFSPGVASNTLYPGVKSLMIKFSQALDLEYRHRGVKVTALCPGFTETEFATQAGIQHVMDASPRSFSQTAEEVVRAALIGNEQGKVVVIPGWQNKMAVLMMRLLPEPLVRSIINTAAAKYRLKD